MWDANIPSRVEPAAVSDSSATMPGALGPFLHLWQPRFLVGVLVLKLYSSDREVELFLAGLIRSLRLRGIARQSKDELATAQTSRTTSTYGTLFVSCCA